MMITKKIKMLLIISLLASAASCEFDSTSSNRNTGPVITENPVIPQFEILTAADGTPDANYTNWFCKPCCYDIEANESYYYPLLIYLHGSSQQTLDKDCYYFGWEYANDEWTHDTAVAFKKNYPCFVYRPLALNNSWDVTTLKKWIDLLIATYRIDTARIYVNGFSMGGFAAVNLANAYASSKPPVYCAAIIVLAAGGVTINDTLKNKSSFWFMHGGKAAEASAVEALYENMKVYAANTGGTETVKENYTVVYKNTNATTATRTSYTRNGKTFLQKTVFPELGHVISSYPYWDPDTIAWIFDQRLDSRK